MGNLKFDIISMGRLVSLLRTVPFISKNFGTAPISKLVFYDANGTATHIEVANHRRVEIYFADPLRRHSPL